MSEKKLNDFKQWNPATKIYPKDNHEVVLVRGFGEKKKHYIYEFARYERVTASRRWVKNCGGATLWFEPIEWIELPIVKPPTKHA